MRACASPRAHKLASRDVSPEAFVFATCSGRPLSQRNVARALLKAQQRATDDHRQPTFPVLHEGTEYPPALCPRCTRSATPSRRALCSPARALTKSPSCSDTATPRSPASSTSMRSPTPPPAHAVLTHDRRVRPRPSRRPPERGGRRLGIAAAETISRSTRASAPYSGAGGLRFLASKWLPYGGAPNEQTSAAGRKPTKFQAIRESRRPDSNRGPLHYE